MNVEVEFDGNSAAGYIVSVSRTEKLCMPGQEWEVILSKNCPLTIKPWTPVVIWEDGSKVLTGYTGLVGQLFSPQVNRYISGLDTWKRAIDGWNDEEYVTGEGDTIHSLIRRFLDLAGLNYQFNTDYDTVVPAGLTISYQPYSEIVMDLCSALNLFIRVNPDGKLLIGDVVSDGGTGPNLSVGDNMETIDVMRRDENARNKIVVWGPTSRAIIRSDEDWAVVDHTMVYANPYVDNAWGLAAALHSNLHTLERVTTVTSPGDPDRRVGQEVTIDGPSGTYDGKARCTTIKTRTDDGGYKMASIFDERCAIFGGGPGLNDGRDIIVATYECGVWRCKDIWADTIHWEPLNIGLEDDYLGLGSSTFKCEWFIRDPYEPNTLCYLLTQAGILKTYSTEPGYENWMPAYMNHQLNSIHYEDCEDPVTIADYKFTRIRSTIARRGVYYFTVMADWNGIERTEVGLTNDGFTTVNFGSYSNVPDSYAYACITGWLWGDCNYNHQRSVVGPVTWHEPWGPGYKSGESSAGCGGLAAWHRNDNGCTVTGVSSAQASNGGPSVWFCERVSSAIYGSSLVSGGVITNGDNVLRAPSLDYKTTHCFYCYNEGDPLDPSCPFGSRPCDTYEPGHNQATSWLKCPTIHIPYDQTYAWWNGISLRGTDVPNVYYLSPGLWEGSIVSTTGAYPTRVTPTGIHTIVLPWSPSVNSCHVLQGSIGTYTQDRNYVYAFSADKPSRFATSENEAVDWDEKDSVPFKTSCFSGFPYSENKVYAGRDPIRDPSTPGSPPDYEDDALIYVTWDGGVTWHDVTGDLWDQTQALGKRYQGVNPLGTAGLLTIAPRYT